MSTLKKPQTKVVDNLKTQLEELLAALNKLYDTINTEMSRNLSSDFDEVNSLLVEGFRSVLDQKPPIDVVESASSGSSDEEGDDSDVSEGVSEESENSEEKAETRAANAEAVMKMVQSWTAS